MRRTSRLLGILSSVALLAALTGCDYFGTHEGYEEDDAPRWGVSGMATYELVGVSPSTASAGEQVTLYTVSEAGAPVNSYDVDAFWFCTYDGEAAMLETGGDSYDASVDADQLFDNVDDVDLTVEELDNSVISTVTFTVPDGTVTGEGLVFVPNGDVRYFDLGIQ